MSHSTQKMEVYSETCVAHHLFVGTFWSFNVFQLNIDETTKLTIILMLPFLHINVTVFWCKISFWRHKQRNETNFYCYNCITFYVKTQHNWNRIFIHITRHIILHASLLHKVSQTTEKRGLSFKKGLKAGSDPWNETNLLSLGLAAPNVL